MSARPSKYLLAAASVRMDNNSDQRFDAGETAAMARSLEHVEAEVIKTLYTELRAVQFVPMISGIDPGADVFTWTQSNYAGDAKAISHRATDLSNIDIQLEQFSSNVASYGAEYSYSVQELRAIALASKRGFQIDLDTVRATMQAEVIARRLDKVIAFGDPSSNSKILGFLNNPSVAVQAAVGVWSGLTADQLILELFAMVNGVINASRETVIPDTILLPTTQYLLVAQKPLGNNADRSVLSYFIENMKAQGRAIDVMSWPLLSLANAGLNGPRGVCYKRDVKNVGSIVPLAFEAQPPQAKGLLWTIPADARCGGAAFFRPVSAIYRDGL